MRKQLCGLASLFAIATLWMATTASPACAVPVDAQPIYVQNNTPRTLWVAVRYKPAGSSTYITDGFWKVDPGQKTLVIYNGNSRFIYVHVHDDLGSIPRPGTTPIRQTVRGRAVELYPEDTGNGYEPWTLSIGE